ncbi:hypothetical protein CANARDRAFT_183242, partial [[Candida] arabinofermentans NRRL YB-2248]
MSSRRSRRSQAQQQNQPHDFEEEYSEPHGSFEEDEASLEEVTRCTCNNDELIIPPNAGSEFDDIDTGFFIQCETCSVWQHGYCVGIRDEENAPEKYWCEQCKPELHDLFVDKYGFTRSRYNPHVEATRRNKRKRPTAVSKDTTHTFATPSSTAGAHSASPSTPAREDLKRERLLEEHERRKRTRGTLNSRDAEYELMLKKALEESAKESGVQPEELVVSSSNESAARETRSARSKKPSIKEENSGESDSNTTATSVGTQTQKSPPTSATSSTFDRSIATVPKLDKSKARKKSKDNLNESKPFTANIPSSRISMNEMRRRVFSIMEFISNVQMELSNDEDFKSQLLASTEQAEDGNDDSLDPDAIQLQKTLLACYNGSVLKLDSLTSRLNEWDNKFG